MSLSRDNPLMPRKKQLHSSPLVGSHPILSNHIVQAGFSEAVLRKFLWLINAHDRLVAFPKICQNVLHILKEAETVWGLSEDYFHLADVKPILSWIVDNQDTLSSDLGDEFNLQPRNEGDHPIINRGASRHPLYTAMWNTSESEELKIKYLLLQAHMLFAHTSVLVYANNQDEYERYDGEAEWKGFDNSPYLATLAVRDLSTAQNADYLKQFRVDLPPEQFSKQVLTQVQISDMEMLKRILAFEKFIQKSAGLRSWRKRIGAGGSGKGGSNNVTGFVDFSVGLFGAEIQLGDVDDPDTTLIKLTQISETGLNTKESAELFDSDLYPDEFDSDELYLISPPDATTTLGNVASISTSQLKHIVKANQLFPWGVNLLTMQEVAHLIKSSNKIAVELLQINNRSDEENLRLEALILMRIMLFTGSDFDRALGTIVLEENHQNVDAPIAYLYSEDKGPLWRIRAIQPVYKTTIAANSSGEKIRSDYFYIEENAFTDIYIFKYLSDRKQLNLKTPSAHSIPQVTDKSRLFRRRPERLQKTLKELCLEIDPTGRLTVFKINDFLFRHLLNSSNRDICAASTITGFEHRLAHVRMFYSVIPIAQLQAIYSETVTSIVNVLHVLLGKTYNKKSFQTALEQYNYVGSRNCPTLDTVKSGIERLRVDIDKSYSDGDLLKFHNLYTLFITWQFAFTTSCRAIRTPYIPLEKIDIQSGIGLLTDKDDGSGYKSRLIWIPPSIIESMQAYERYRMGISLPIMHLEELPPIFFVEETEKQKIKPIEVRPTSMQNIMHSYLPYRPNVHRRFMRTELLDGKCPVEVVDSWMGHWHIGEEPWATHSSFSFHEYQTTLKQFIVPILEQINLLDSLPEGF